eukprot:5957889-Prymnesium_polylepis.1
MPEFESAHLGLPTGRGRAEAEKVGHLSLDFHGFWLASLAGRKVEPGPTCYHTVRARPPAGRRRADRWKVGSKLMVDAGAISHYANRIAIGNPVKP